MGRKLMNLRLDEAVKREFKAHCALIGKNMGERLEYLMKLDIKGKIK